MQKIFHAVYEVYDSIYMALSLMKLLKFSELDGLIIMNFYIEFKKSTY